MNLSYWEHKTWFSNVDFTIVGSGIVGLNCALHLRQLFPQSKILVLEKGTLPQGASTKNAGFACFGSISELLSDLRSHPEEKVFDLVQKRYQGIQLLRELLGDDSMGYVQHGGHELFLESNSELFQTCLQGMDHLNALLEPIFGEQPFCTTDNIFGFGGIKEHYITHRFEGQLDTGKMMEALLLKCFSKNIQVFNGITVNGITDSGDDVEVRTGNFGYTSKKVLVATNGFASQLIKQETVTPARAQVLITKPIPGLPIQGTFHLDEGYYYFRNIDDRILFGGGRNLDFKTEETTAFGQTKLVQEKLEELLRTVILPKHSIEIDSRWSGIMGVGEQKSPILKMLSKNVGCGVRLGGMGVALGSLVGRELAQMAQ
nr:FAD-dependent oxidoreductase [Allomuricauda sp.]